MPLCPVRSSPAPSAVAELEALLLGAFFVEGEEAG
jgi:hypothetical protein